MKRVIGIDIGTTTISAAVTDLDFGTVLHSECIENNCFIQTDHSWEKIQDAEKIVANGKALLNKLINQFDDIEAIGLTGQMHGIVYTDSSGTAVSPLYTWQDGRGSILDMYGKSVVDRVCNKCNIKVASGYGLITHLYNVEHGMVPDNAVSICTIPDYFGMQLVHRTLPLMHISMAASLGFFDIKNLQFMGKELEIFGIKDFSLLPEVTDDVVILGNYRGIPVLTAIGDNQASYLGAVGIYESYPLINIGTGGQISVASEVISSEKGIETRPLLKNKYIHVGASLCGGRSYSILERFFRSYLEEAGFPSGSQYEVLNRLAEKGSRGENIVKVNTLFSGSRSNPSERGSITEISESNFTPENLAYGFLCGMVKELHDLYISIQKNSEVKHKVVIASGNGIRKNKVLQEIIKEQFQAEVRLAACEDEAAYGAALVAKLL